jgi:long-chain acyl-CoA synthetase
VIIAYRITALPGIPETKKMTETLASSNHVVEVFSQCWDEPLLIEPHEDRKWSYGEVLRRAVAVDDWLREAGYTDDEPVRIAPLNSAIPVTVYLSALLSGRLVYAIDPSRGDQDIAEMLAIADGEHLLTDDSSLLNHEDAVELRPVPPRDTSKSEALNRLSEAEMDDQFLVTFTSGTTGTPKGVLHSFENLVQASLRFGERFGFSTDNTFYHTLPMGYMAGILNALVLPLCHGSKIVVGRRTSAATAAQFFEPAMESGVNVFWLTPTILRMLLQLCSGPYDDADSAVGCVATEPLATELQEEFEAEFEIDLYETYGLSETLFITTEYPGDGGDQTGVGPTLSNVDLQVETDGELLVDAPWLFLDYVNRDGAIKQGHTYQTGDIGEVCDGTVHITGRKKDLIVRNGINISPTRIEEVLSALSSVSGVAVFGRETDDVGEQVVAVVEADAESVRKRTLEQEIVDELGTDHRPDDIVLVEELPRTEDDSVDYDAVRIRVAEI